MQFTYDKRIDYWVTPVTLKGQKIRLRIIRDYPENDLESIAEEILERIRENWKAIEKNICDSLHNLYNEGWAEPEAGSPRLSREQFLEKIRLSWIDVMEEESMSLIFTDSGLFGGHVVDLFWTPEKMYEAIIAG